MAEKKRYVCKCCGKEFYSYKENCNYCSHECRTKDNRFTHNCDYCGKEFKITRNKYDKYINGETKHLYCSRECANKGMVTSVTKVCEECGKEFTICNSFKNVQKYCSRDCYENSRRQKAKVCPICQKIFFPKRNGQIYCSNECKWKSAQNREKCICDYCGKSFERIKSEVDKNKQHFCSVECKYNARRWKVEDIEILRNNYYKISSSEIQKLLTTNYTIRQITNKASHIGLSKNNYWSDEEINILSENYSRKTLDEVCKLLPNRSFSSILGKAHSMNLVGLFYINKIYSNEEIEYLKNNYLNKSNEEMSVVIGRTPESIEQKLIRLNCFRPQEIKKTGYKDLIEFMRSRLYSWKQEVLKYYNRTCILTVRTDNIVVHHIRSFNLIFDETIYVLNFPEYDDFSKYSDEELSKFVDTFLDIQDTYHEYVCITESVHKLFHKEYGNGNNTVEQWNEFVINFKNKYYYGIN